MALCCPKTFTGFCLADNTPIAITINNGVLVSWTNLVTGVVTPGNPPAGTGICEVPSTVTVEIEPLTCAKDEVTVCQGTSPWVVSGTVSVTEPVTVDGTLELGAATLAALETITVLQGTSPWVVTGTFSSTPLDCATDSVEVCQGTSPWIVSGTVSVNEPVTVDAVDFDIRNLLFATDKVDASGSVVTLDAATLAALETITVLQGTSPWVVTGSISSNPLTCETDSITVCPPPSGFGVSVLNFPASVEVSNDVGNPLPVTGPLTNAELRASSVGVHNLLPATRIPVHDGNNAGTGDQQSYTVTAGKDLYVTTLVFEMRNTDPTTEGQITILDGGVAGTQKFQFFAPTRAVGTNTVPVLASMTFPTPVVFGTDVYVRVDAGAVRWSLAITGYEE